MSHKGQGTQVFELSFGDAGLDQHKQQTLGGNLGQHDVTGGLAVHQKLLAYGVGQRRPGLAALAEHLGGELRHGAGGLGENLVQFGNENVDFGNELDETLGNENDAVGLAHAIASFHQVHNFVHNGGKRLLFAPHLLANQNQVGMGLHAALHGEVRSGAPHHADEVVRVMRAAGVGAQVADKLGVGSSRGVKAKADLDVAGLHVAVHSLRHADDATGLAQNGAAVGQVGGDAIGKVVGNEGGVAVGAISADNNQTVQIQVVYGFNYVVEVSVAGNLAATGEEHVEATHVAELIHHLGSHDFVLTVHQPVQAAVEANELRLGVAQVQVVKHAGYDVVATGGGPAAENHADLQNRVRR
ncbi:capsular exopolysaccharide synthesis family protein [Babesia caballi]|uniref:Capsular exopolysaccharide synthesis family protein n=1 Tax=Babesia caballi TaxID=5871 RepID=A0AAV4LVC6_BABCB|nr:capsular exopolysaccharide synthesis family protein [Babesia caballi]